jgi:hypothetical protein
MPTMMQKISSLRKIPAYVALASYLALAGAVFTIPSVYGIKRFIKQKEPFREQRVAQEILNLTTNKYSADNLLAPYLRENPKALSWFNGDYETLSKLSLLLEKPTPDSSSSASSNQVSSISTNKPGEKLENKVSRFSVKGNGFSVDIKGDSYFSDAPLASNLTYLSGMEMVFDKENSTLYRLSRQRQRLIDPIKNVSNIRFFGNEVYVVQDDNLFLFNNGRLEKKAELSSPFLELSLQQINNTPFSVFFCKNGESYLVRRTQNPCDESLKKQLQEALSKGRLSIRPSERTRIELRDNSLCVNSRDYLKIIRLGETKAITFSSPKETNTTSRVLDYAVYRPTEKDGTVVLFEGSFKQEDSPTNTNYCLKVFRGTNLVSTILGETFNENSSFSNDERENPEKYMPWIFPSEFKRKIRKQLNLVYPGNARTTK